MNKIKTILLICSIVYFQSGLAWANPKHSNGILVASSADSVTNLGADQTVFTNFNDLEPTSEIFTHQFQVTAVVLDGSGWKIEDIIKRNEIAANIFAKCKVKLVLKILHLKAKESEIDIGWWPTFVGGNNVLLLAEKVEAVSKPIMFYVRKSMPYPAWAYMTKFHAKIPTTLNDTIWISARTNTEEFLKDYQITMSVEGHELAHLLLESGHVQGKNIIGEKIEDINDEVLPEQCDKIRSSHLVHPAGQSLWFK